MNVCPVKKKKKVTLVTFNLYTLQQKSTNLDGIQTLQLNCHYLLAVFSFLYSSLLAWLGCRRAWWKETCSSPHRAASTVRPIPAGLTSPRWRRGPPGAPQSRVACTKKNKHSEVHDGHKSPTTETFPRWMYREAVRPRWIRFDTQILLGSPRLPKSLFSSLKHGVDQEGDVGDNWRLSHRRSPAVGIIGAPPSLSLCHSCVLSFLSHKWLINKGGVLDEQISQLSRCWRPPGDFTRISYTCISDASPPPSSLFSSLLRLIPRSFALLPPSVSPQLSFSPWFSFLPSALFSLFPLLFPA